MKYVKWLGSNKITCPGVVVAYCIREKFAKVLRKEKGHYVGYFLDRTATKRCATLGEALKILDGVIKAFVSKIFARDGEAS
jgi:hypothetical protein